MGTVIGITGSVGKTSTKKICNDILSTQFQTTCNSGNFNNELGLPITVCKAEFEDDFLITEMGMSALGEISQLCKIALPTWGLITNIGTAHMEFLGSRDNIAKAKSELALAIPDNIGTMFLWTDDEYRDFIIDYTKLKERNIKIIYFGGNQFHEHLESDQLWFEDVEFCDDGTSKFKLCYKGFGSADAQSHAAYLNLSGTHNIINACGAAAIALNAGVSMDAILSVLKEETPEHGRQEILTAKAGYQIINDAYNANLQSSLASLEMFSQIHVEGKKIAFLGDMFELGDLTKSVHEQVGEAAANSRVDVLICVGKLSKDMFEAAKNKMSADSVFHFENLEDAKDKLISLVDAKDAVLFKASNSMGFSALAEELAG